MIAISLTFNKTSSQETRVLQIRSRLADPGSLLPWEEGGLSERDRGSIGRMWGHFALARCCGVAVLHDETLPLTLKGPTLRVVAESSVKGTWAVIYKPARDCSI